MIVGDLSTEEVKMALETFLEPYERPRRIVMAGYG